ncbi:MAG: TIGR00730 family Rossman fold protein [Bdellovibrionales bacterium]
MAKVAIFCSSSLEVSSMFLAEAEDVGRDLAIAGHTIVYGGANCGMMGRVAQAALKAGGKVIGIIPDLDFAKGLNQPGLTHEVVVHNLAERKALMLQEADMAVALPGGIGTLDEVFEALVMKCTGQWPKPIYFHNFLDFWTPVIEALTLIAEQRMITQPLHELYEVCLNRKELLTHLQRGN